MKALLKKLTAKVIEEERAKGEKYAKMLLEVRNL